MADQAHFSTRGSAAHARSIGITQRAAPLSFPWTGELKVRFSDFQVNEIGLDGNIVRLRTVGMKTEPRQNAELKSGKTTVPKTELSESKTEDQDDKTLQEPQEKLSEQDRSKKGSKDNESKEQPPPKKEVSAEDVKALESLGGKAFAEGLMKLYQEGPATGTEKREPVTSEPLEDKSKRGQIHQEVRRIFKSTIETTTDGAGAIVATIIQPQKGQKRRRGGGGGGRERREDKPAGEYLHFTLFKENRDTMDAINQIARIMRIKPQIIAYAGTKDRRASTSQRCSVRYARESSVAGINGRLWGIHTGDYKYHEEPIRLGQLRGNEFAITIKNCHMFNESATTPLSEKLEVMKKNVQAALDHMAEHGWINYFGHQRFGTHEIGTHQVGKLILSDRYEEAVESLLSYDPEIAAKAEDGEEIEDASKRDEYNRHLACMLFRTGQDTERAAEIMPRRFSAETCILRHLNRQGSQSAKDFVGAIVHITRGLRTMYIHAYQSHVWNTVVSKRWELYGEKVMKGDLVISETEATPLNGGKDQDGDDIINPMDDEDEAPVYARPLTEEEASSGRYSIHDLVLPTPGYEVIYPENDIGELYKEFMGREENGGLDPHKMRRLRREFSLPGRYRKVMNKFLDKPSIEFRTYTDDTEQMHPTDLDLVKAAKTTAGDRNLREEGGEPTNKRVKVDNNDDTADSEMADTNGTVQPEESEKPSGKNGAPDVKETKIAALVKFQLGTSAYATVTLRELMGDPPES